MRSQCQKGVIMNATARMNHGMGFVDNGFYLVYNTNGLKSLRDKLHDYWEETVKFYGNILERLDYKIPAPGLFL